MSTRDQDYTAGVGSTGGSHQCGRCGTWYFTAHYCSGIPSGPQAHVYRYFSEDELRRIIREEIDRAKLGD